MIKHLKNICDKLFLTIYQKVNFMESIRQQINDKNVDIVYISFNFNNFYVRFYDAINNKYYYCQQKNDVSLVLTNLKQYNMYNHLTKLNVIKIIIPQNSHWISGVIKNSPNLQKLYISHTKIHNIEYINIVNGIKYANKLRKIALFIKDDYFTLNDNQLMLVDAINNNKSIISLSMYSDNCSILFDMLNSSFNTLSLLTRCGTNNVSLNKYLEQANIVQLMITKKKLTSMPSGDLIKAIGNNKYITNLHIKNYDIDNITMGHLGNAIANNKSINKLTINCDNISVACIKKLTHGLSKNTTIHNLKISSLNDNGIRLLFHNIKQYKRITHINLCNSPIKKIAIIKEFLVNNTFLKKIVVSYDDINWYNELIDIFNDNYRLTNIYMGRIFNYTYRHELNHIMNRNTTISIVSIILLAKKFNVGILGLLPKCLIKYMALFFNI